MTNFPPLVPRYKGIKNIPKVLRNPLPVLQSYRKQYGDTFAFYLGGQRLNVLSFDPVFCQHILQKNHRNYEKSDIQTVVLGKYLGRGLLTAKGSYWLRQRRLIQPGFHRNKLQALTQLMNEEIERFLPQLDRVANEQGTIDIYDEGLTIAFNIICRSLFSDSMTDKHRMELKHNLTAVQEFFVKQMRLPFLSTYFRWTGQAARAQAKAEHSRAVLSRIIEKRRTDKRYYNDLLDMLLESRYEDTGEGMNDEQILAETQVLFAAGHETSANTIAWSLHSLSQHPQIVERLRAEWSEVLGDAVPTFDDLRKLDYTMQVIQESMRLHPPAWIVDRVALDDDEVAGWTIPKGTMVTPFIYGVHHNADLWEAPNDFRPERFDKSLQRKRPAYAYFPFGGGPRLCIGNNFALMEVQLVLIHLLRRYDLHVVTAQQIEEQPLVTLRPRNGIKLRLSNHQKTTPSFF